MCHSLAEEKQATYMVDASFNADYCHYNLLSFGVNMQMGAGISKTRGDGIICSLVACW